MQEVALPPNGACFWRLAVDPAADNLQFRCLLVLVGVGAPTVAVRCLAIMNERKDVYLVFTDGASEGFRSIGDLGLGDVDWQGRAQEGMIA
jgi:hypothetical protein